LTETEAESAVEDANQGLQIVQLQHADPVQDVYYTQRAETVEDITRTIEEIAQMYKRLTVMVGEQEDVVVRIDERVSETLTTVGKAHTELTTLVRTVSTSQWLLIKVFFILIVFAVFFVVFVA